MTEQIHVRVGGPEDLDQVMDLARMMHEEIGITAMNPARILPEVYASLHQEGGIMGLIGGKGEPLEGGLLLRIGKFFYSDEDVLEDKGLFIHPDFRSARGGRAARLADWAKGAANYLDLPLFMGVQNDVRTKGKLRLYERIFGEPIGAFFLYRPPHQTHEEAA